MTIRGCLLQNPASVRQSWARRTIEKYCKDRQVRMKAPHGRTTVLQTPRSVQATRTRTRYAITGTGRSEIPDSLDSGNQAGICTLRSSIGWRCVCPKETGDARSLTDWFRLHLSKKYSKDSTIELAVGARNCAEVSVVRWPVPREEPFESLFADRCFSGNQPCLFREETPTGIHE